MTSASKFVGVAATLGVASAAQGQIAVPFCTGFFNDDFSSGSAFWSVNTESGGWGDSFGGVFTSFAPLSLVPQPAQGNVATFFTEAFAAGDCEAPLGTARNTQFTLGRTLTSVPSGGNLNFRFGAQISYVLVNQSAVRYKIRLIVRNLSNDTMIKCTLAEDKDGINNNQVKEDIFVVPFQALNICNCQTGFIYNTGDVIEILLIGTVEATAQSMSQSAFIGGPFFFDDFEFCNIFCIIEPPGDPVKALAFVGGEDAPNLAESGDALELAGVDAYERALKRLDADGDGVIVSEEWLDYGLSIGGVPAILSTTPDLNRDGVVDQRDVVVMMDMVNGAVEIDSRGDLNGDGRVDGRDLEILLDALP